MVNRTQGPAPPFYCHYFTYIYMYTRKRAKAAVTLPDTIMIPVNRTAYVYLYTERHYDKRSAAATRYPSYMSRKNSSSLYKASTCRTVMTIMIQTICGLSGRIIKKTKPTTAPKRTPRGTVLRLLAFKSKTEKHRVDHFL